MKLAELLAEVNSNEELVITFDFATVRTIPNSWDKYPIMQDFIANCAGYDVVQDIMVSGVRYIKAKYSESAVSSLDMLLKREKEESEESSNKTIEIDLADDKSEEDVAAREKYLAILDNDKDVCERLKQSLYAFYHNIWMIVDYNVDDIKVYLDRLLDSIEAMFKFEENNALFQHYLYDSMYQVFFSIYKSLYSDSYVWEKANENILRTRRVSIPEDTDFKYADEYLRVLNIVFNKLCYNPYSVSINDVEILKQYNSMRRVDAFDEIDVVEYFV